MKLKTKYIVTISFIHAIFIAATIVIYRHSKIAFIFCEVAIVISIILFVVFYKAIFRPFKLLNAGADSISDKDFSIKFLPVGQPELDKLIAVFNKMIDQLRLERTIASEKDFFLEKLIEASPAAIIILNKNDQISIINPAALSLLNIPVILPPTKVCNLPSPWNLELSKLNETDTIIVQLNGINQYKCYKSYFIDKGVRQTFYIIEELTKELLHAQKQSYEKVIRMMSHEVNNSIGAVNSIIDSTLQYMMKLNPESHGDFIHALEVAKERIINLNLFTKRFANIVQMPPPEFSQCNLIEIINHVLICFHSEFENNNICIKTHYIDEQVFVSFDYQQLELVLINIIKNAIQAIHKNGEINIIILKGSSTVLLIENNGEQINKDIQTKLFEPFFTTKKFGQGIGLTLIREILSNHSCGFSLLTREDGMTEFRISFK